MINKTVTNDEILAAAEMIFASGFENLKLYFMIGLPTETDDDLVAIRDLTLQLRDDHAAARARRAATSAASSAASTRSCRSRAPPISGCRWKTTRRSSGRSSGCAALMAGIDNVYFNIKSERHSFYQALLSLGDRRVAPAIEAAERNGGNWRAAVAEAGVDADFFVFRDRSHDAVLPWDIIDGGMKDSFFRAEFDKALREEWTLPPKRQKENARLLPVLQ